VGHEKVVRKYVFDAQKRGLFLMLAMAGWQALFLSKPFRPIKTGFLPNSMSTDLHTGSMKWGMKDILIIMSNIYQVWNAPKSR